MHSSTRKFPAPIQLSPRPELRPDEKVKARVWSHQSRRDGCEGGCERDAWSRCWAPQWRGNAGKPLKRLEKHEKTTCSVRSMLQHQSCHKLFESYWIYYTIYSLIWERWKAGGPSSFMRWGKSRCVYFSHRRRMIQTELGFNGCCEDRSGCQKGGCHQKGALGLIEELNPAGNKTGFIMIHPYSSHVSTDCYNLFQHLAGHGWHVFLGKWLGAQPHSRARDVGLSMDHGLIWIINWLSWLSLSWSEFGPSPAAIWSPSLCDKWTAKAAEHWLCSDPTCRFLGIQHSLELIGFCTSFLNSFWRGLPG